LSTSNWRWRPGVVALGKDIQTAEHNAELVEETAQIAVLSTLCRNAGLYDAQD
jgi:ribulose-5-phosphate 4-epimerase/fuculose-1-phosphate aldolase